MERYFSIKELSNLSGIKAHTIRIWEKRYRLLEPVRTDTNIRQYDNTQLKKLIKVTTLLESGYKISKIACMENREMSNLTEQSAQGNQSQEAVLLHIEELVRSMQQMDEERFEKVFSNCVLRYGLRDTFVDILYPFLNKVGIMWCCDKILPANEHFITSLIKQKLFTAIDGNHTSNKTDRIFVLALPPGEHHELGLLLAHFMIKSRGHRSIYLGSDVPYVNVRPSVILTQATDLLVFLVKKSAPNNTHTYLTNLVRDFKYMNIYVATSKQGIDTSLFPEIKFLHHLNDLEAHL